MILRYHVHRHRAGYRATQEREYRLFKGKGTTASVTAEPATCISTGDRLVSVGTAIQHVARYCLKATVYLYRYIDIFSLRRKRPVCWWLLLAREYQCLVWDKKKKRNVHTRIPCIVVDGLMDSRERNAVLQSITDTKWYFFNWQKRTPWWRGPFRIWRTSFTRIRLKINTWIRLKCNDRNETRDLIGIPHRNIRYYFVVFLPILLFFFFFLSKTVTISRDNWNCPWVQGKSCKSNDIYIYENNETKNRTESPNYSWSRIFASISLAYQIETNPYIPPQRLNVQWRTMTLLIGSCDT